MNHGNLNESEWNDPKNWPGGLYRSRADRRLIVPKRRGYGVTLNFGNPKAIILFVALLAMPLVVFLALHLSGVHFNRH